MYLEEREGSVLPEAVIGRVVKIFFGFARWELSPMVLRRRGVLCVPPPEGSRIFGSHYVCGLKILRFCQGTDKGMVSLGI